MVLMQTSVDNFVLSILFFHPDVHSRAQIQVTRLAHQVSLATELTGWLGDLDFNIQTSGRLDPEDSNNVMKDVLACPGITCSACVVKIVQCEDKCGSSW